MFLALTCLTQEDSCEFGACLGWQHIQFKASLGYIKVNCLENAPQIKTYHFSRIPLSLPPGGSLRSSTWEARQEGLCEFKGQLSL